ncbi:hypothetical protein KC207_06235 [Phycicoccus sp. BSK3Z-2]|uniref:ABC3 transporter permease C-terminal domain-containing protein n=1 Tax=Phycicoccus avicenniae TaxID=2828860 RepID=A0A941D706_9MICO|nr:FtsX-like permease family protein [Phycicoccus avicenniae]MBR7742888.1 hypothetical protein [Phycicoccus avicenniae]
MRARVLLVRRAGAHPLAVLAVTVSVAMALVVVVALRLLTATIGDAGVRSALEVPAADRSLVLSGTLDPGDTAAVDALVADVGGGLPGARVTRVSTVTSRGLPGRAGTDRAALAETDGLAGAVTVVDGRLPAPPEGKPGVVEVVLPVAAADGLDVAVGDRLALTDLVDDDAPPLDVEVVGTVRPDDVDAALWLDLPLGVVGVTSTEFTTYGPFLLAPGTLDGGLLGRSSATWRVELGLTGVDAGSLDGVRADVAEAVTTLRRESGLPLVANDPDTAAPATVPLDGARVSTVVPAELDAARLVADRIRASLLTPVLLLALLGGTALVGSAGLLAGLREEETRLLRVRGASSTRLARLGLGEALAVAAVGVLVTLALAPGTTRAVAGVPGPWWRPADAVDPLLWSTVLPLAAGAVGVAVVTGLWVGRDTRGRSSARLAAGSGLDLALLVLAALALVQLRRYDASGSTTVDPLTGAAPALVVAGFSVLALRLVPLLSRLAVRAGTRRPGLDLAWGGWQLARRGAQQTGVILLVLLAFGMGTIALAHDATVTRAIEDQSAFEAGAPLRVDRGVPGRTSSTTGAVVEEAAGADRVVPVSRGTTSLGGLDGVTVLGLDASAAGTVLDPRADTLRGASWPDLAGRLAAQDRPPPAVPLPEGTERLTLELAVDSPVEIRRFGFRRGDGFTGAVHVEDGRGVVAALPVGGIGEQRRAVTVDLGSRRLTPPLAVVGVEVDLPDFVSALAPAGSVRLDLGQVTADGQEVPVDGLVDGTDDRGLWLALPPAADRPVPVLATPAVAEALQGEDGRRVLLPLGGREVPVEVVGVVDALPTAADPAAGVALDLATVAATPEAGAPGSFRSRTVLEPGEWWSAPADVEAAAAQVRADAAYGTRVVVRDELVAERRADPVNAGMRSAMALVAGASLVLAAVGFAASSTALARRRRAENGVLVALGVPPARLARVLEAERLAVVVGTVAVGLLLGAAAALAVVPLLAGGDGHPQVPAVDVVLPPLTVLGFAGALTLVLTVLGWVVVRDDRRRGRPPGGKS